MPTLQCCAEALTIAATLDIPLTTYPTLTEAAALLGVSASTLSRRSDLAFERMGERDKRVPAGEVMRLAGIYRKRSLGEVAAELVAYAREQAAAHAEDVQEQIERYFEQAPAPVIASADFLAEARRALPAALYEEVARVYRGAGSTAPAALIGAEGRLDATASQSV